MATTTDVVHLRTGGCAANLPLLHQAIDLMWRSNCPLRQSLDEYTLPLVLADL
jgi:hypothetical protein